MSLLCMAGTFFSCTPIFASTDAEKLQSLSDRLSACCLVVIVMAIVLLLCIIVLSMLVYSKLRKKKPASKKDTQKESYNNIEEQIKKISSDIKSLREEVNSLSSKVKSYEESDNFEETTDNDIPEKENTLTVKAKTPTLQIQYLKAGANEEFFYEGDSKSPEGCQFKVTFKEKKEGAEGELNVISDLENIKAIPSTFLKNVIRIDNNIALKEAVSFTTKKPGICEYNQQNDFGTWIIKRPIEIELNK